MLLSFLTSDLIFVCGCYVAETIDALIDALREFKGGVVVVSHDQHFVNSVCQELWVVGDQKVERFHGSIDEYKTHVLKE